MKSTKFMFINKDARSDSLSHSHKSERIQIHSHVQKGRRYKKSDGGIVYASQLPALQPGRRPDNSNDPDQQSEDKVTSPSDALTPKAPGDFWQHRSTSPLSFST